MSKPRNVTNIFPARNLGGPHRWVEGVRISRRQGRGGIKASLAVFIGPPQAPWGPVGAPQHQQQGWITQRQYDTGAQQQPQQGEAPQQQGAAMGGGGVQHKQQQQRGWSPQQLSADAPQLQQQQGWPTQQPHGGGTPQQSQQGWVPEQAGGGGVRWGGGAVGAVSPRQKQSNWQQQQQSSSQQQIDRGDFGEVSAGELKGSGQRQQQMGAPLEQRGRGGGGGGTRGRWVRRGCNSNGIRNRARDG